VPTCGPDGPKHPPSVPMFPVKTQSWQIKDLYFYQDATASCKVDGLARYKAPETRRLQNFAPLVEVDIATTDVVGLFRMHPEKISKGLRSGPNSAQLGQRGLQTRWIGGLTLERLISIDSRGPKKKTYQYISQARRLFGWEKKTKGLLPEQLLPSRPIGAYTSRAGAQLYQTREIPQGMRGADPHRHPLGDLLFRMDSVLSQTIAGPQPPLC